MYLIIVPIWIVRSLELWGSTEISSFIKFANMNKHFWIVSFCVNLSISFKLLNEHD